MYNDTKPALPEPENDDEDDDRQHLEKQNSETQQIIETGSVTPTKGKYIIHCLTIIGQIEGHYILPPQNKTTKYEHVIPQLVAIQENPEIEGLMIILNTVGGDVEAGLAIAELISGIKKPTVSIVLGGGHSIGVPLAVSADKSFIVPSATMTLHPVRMNGVVLGVPQTLSYFDKMQERITNFVETNSNMSADLFRKLMMNTGELVMDVGTVLNGQQAVEHGLIDHLGGLADATKCLYDMIEKNKKQKDDRKKQLQLKKRRHTGDHHAHRRGHTVELKTVPQRRDMRHVAQHLPINRLIGAHSGIATAMKGDLLSDGNTFGITSPNVD